MELVVAKHLGFCAGVARAVDTAYKQAKKQAGKGKCQTLGPIIHNRVVTDDLAKCGTHIINNLDEWEEGPVIIRAHGIPPHVEDEMIKRNIPYIDRTCPHVKAIHHKAAKSVEQNRTLIVLGKADHPEVIGVLGYGGPDSLVIEDETDITKIDPAGKYTLVVQTTYKKEIFDRVAKAFQIFERCESFESLERFESSETFEDDEGFTGFNIIIHNTICNATEARQKEAEEISKIVDIAIILGDPDSANTKKLYEISQKNCPYAILAQSIHDIRLQDLSIDGRIGIMAGASTPPSITKEALFNMSDLEKNNVQQDIDVQKEPESFEDMLNETLVTLHTGDVVKGTVIQVTGNEITVNLGYKSDGIITKGEYSMDPNVDLVELVKPGEVLEVLVMRVNDGDGNVLVSKRRLEAQTNYKLIEQAYNDKAPVPGRIQDLVRGGLIANIFGNRVFVPSSQISNRYVEDLSVFKGNEYNFNILEFDRSKRRIVAGRKDLAAQEQKERREELFAALEVGQKLEGTVSRITDFGAFIDLGGVDGLVHISELAWRRVRRVSDVLSVGESVIVTVIDINPEKNKISLTLKDINNNPWNNITNKYPVGSLVEGTVVRMAAFGAFVNLEDGIDGLVHVSQISDKHVAKPDDELSVNQKITVKVTEIDLENKKISLSKKQADAELSGVYDDDYADDYDDDDYYDDEEMEADSVEADVVEVEDVEVEEVTEEVVEVTEETEEA